MKSEGTQPYIHIYFFVLFSLKNGSRSAALEKGSSRRDSWPVERVKSSKVEESCRARLRMGSKIAGSQDTELRGRALACSERGESLRVRIPAGQYNPVQEGRGHAGTEKRQPDCKRTEVSVKQR